MEEGGINLYGFTKNAPQNLIDTDGLSIKIGYGPLPSIPPTPCTSVNDIGWCVNICLLQNKSFGSCTVFTTTKFRQINIIIGIIRLYWYEPIVSCLCGHTPACPFRLF